MDYMVTLLENMDKGDVNNLQYLSFGDEPELVKIPEIRKSFIQLLRNHDGDLYSKLPRPTEQLVVKPASEIVVNQLKKLLCSIDGNFLNEFQLDSIKNFANSFEDKNRNWLNHPSAENLSRLSYDPLNPNDSIRSWFIILGVASKVNLEQVQVQYPDMDELVVFDDIVEHVMLWFTAVFPTKRVSGFIDGDKVLQRV